MRSYILNEALDLKIDNLTLKHKLFDVSNSIQLALTEGTSSTPVKFINHFENHQSKVCFNFCLKGATRFGLSGGLPSAEATPEYINAFVIPFCTVFQEITCHKSLSLLTFYINASAFIDIMGQSVEILPRAFLDPVERVDMCYWEDHHWKPVVKNILFQIFHNDYSPVSERIFIESKTLELIAFILELYVKGSGKQFTISKSDIDRVQYARELLLKDMANPPSLSELAKQVGTNEYTLKKGFKEVFDLPVFKYLQQERLTKAYQLFESTDMQVREVALMVGYESLSSFSRAFVKFYGISPGQVKRIPFKTI